MAEQTFENGENDNNTWFDVFNSIYQLLQSINEKIDDAGMSFHESSLILNKLETALSIVVSLTTLDIDLTENTRLVLLQLSDCLTQLHHNWATKVDNMRRATVTLPNLGIDVVNMSSDRGRPSLHTPKEILEDLRNFTHGLKFRKYCKYQGGLYTGGSESIIFNTWTGFLTYLMMN